MFRPVSPCLTESAAGSEEGQADAAGPRAGATSLQRSHVRFSGLMRPRASGSPEVLAPGSRVAGGGRIAPGSQGAVYCDPHGIFEGMRAITEAAALEHDALQRNHEAAAVLGRQAWTPSGIKRTSSLAREPGTGRLIPKSTLAARQKVVDPETGETISKGALAARQKVVDPETGETISKNALAKRQKVVDPATGVTVTKGALARRQKVVDPETGETISKGALAARQKVVDPETGEAVTKTTLANRQKRVDPATGETISKAALTQREFRRRKAVKR